MRHCAGVACRVRFDRPAWRTGIPGLTLLLALALLFGQCSQGGGGGGEFLDVIEFSATLQSPRVYLNDPIEIVFNQPVDPRTVFSGIYIYPSVSAGAKRARGEFRVEGNRVIFTPSLPTDPDYTDGGFVPDTEYTMCVPVPGAACSVHIQNSPGLKSITGRGIAQTRAERFLTVRASGSGNVFRPEAAPTRPAVLAVKVRDAIGVEQVLNPIVNLVAGQSWNAGIYTTVQSSPATTLIPGENRSVPRLRFQVTLLDRKAAMDPFEPSRHVAARAPLAIVWAGQPIEANAFKDAGGVLTLRQVSPTTLSASWAVDSNTTDRVVTLAGSGPDFDRIGFTGPLTAELSQGITRQVAPGGPDAVTEIRIHFDEALAPGSTTTDNFQMWHVFVDKGGLEFEPIPPASTLLGSSRRGITHEVIDGKSIVTLRPKRSFPQSEPGLPATVVVTMQTAQYDNAAAPTIKATLLRDLNGYPLAYPERTGWVLGLDANSNPTTVARIDRLDYTNNKTTYPEFIEAMWAFQTRWDVEVPNVIVETFSDQEMMAGDCHSSAAWTKPGREGLYATFGYGGTGKLGNVVIDTAVVFDSDNLPPGPDGVVELDYNRLTVAPTGNITLVGKYPFRINAVESMVIEGTIDASGRNGANAPAGKASAVGRIAGGRGGAGAGDGGDSNTKPLDKDGALPDELRGGPGWPPVLVTCGDPNRSENRLVNLFELNCGGGMGGNRGKPLGSFFRSGCSGNGGGHAQAGIQTDYLCGNDGLNGTRSGIAWVITAASSPYKVALVTAGTGGGAGGNTALSPTATQPRDDIVAGSGGGGGGGLELVSAGGLVVKANARVLAVGGSGGKGYTTLIGSTTLWGGYGGGGSGGSIWLSGTSVTVEAGAVLDARGGIGNPNPNKPSQSGDGGDGYVIIHDRGGNPNVTSTKITPAPVAGRDRYAPSGNGKSVAYSDWYDSGTSKPEWAFDASVPQTGVIVGGTDLKWLSPPSSGQTARISFQGAPDLGGAADPDPTRWYPAGNSKENPCAAWETNIDKLTLEGGLRHIRFKIEFDVGKVEKNESRPIPMAIQRLDIHYKKD